MKKLKRSSFLFLGKQTVAKSSATILDDSDFQKDSQQEETSGGHSDSCFLYNPGVIMRNPCVDAILSFFGAFLPPADDACQEPCALVVGGMWPATVSFARIFLLVPEASTEHEACDVVTAAFLTHFTIHVRDRQFLKLGGFWAVEPQFSPSTHKGAGGLLHKGLYKTFWAKANGAPLVGQLNGTGKFQ